MERTFEMRYESGETPGEFRRVFAEMVMDDVANFSPGLGIGVRDPGIGHLGEFMINDSGAAIYFFYVFGVFAAPLVVALFWVRDKVLLVLLLASKLNFNTGFFGTY